MAWAPEVLVCSEKKQRAAGEVGQCQTRDGSDRTGHHSPHFADAETEATEAKPPRSRRQEVVELGFKPRVSSKASCLMPHGTAWLSLSWTQLLMEPSMLALSQHLDSFRTAVGRRPELSSISCPQKRLLKSFHIAKGRAVNQREWQTSWSL